MARLNVAAQWRDLPLVVQRALAALLIVGLVLAGVGFTQAMATFRWFRDRYRVLQVAGGLTLVALGTLLFFERYWWLQVALNRVLEAVGIDKI